MLAARPRQRRRAFCGCAPAACPCSRTSHRTQSSKCLPQSQSQSAHQQQQQLLQQKQQQQQQQNHVAAATARVVAAVVAATR
eukprot:8916480-Lingulodinium_polyedra.AAC.1